ncbi:flagellar basal-body MS-ring/collar protein FliF [Pseudooceanicola atlanticus]|uniref:Flagellar M-ring protein n=1 Tax=Pseudooceanicola atlanticus TaxID=1461694 RepID=A0A0A0E7H2_9RHOB|nr:flagellar basal-body MS-ring/collar protein FliF [Pseudooceanicola atlanticus]KGM46951.1 flagellar M-ring protein FliF [Pseudooceanicola atlanticus]
MQALLENLKALGQGRLIALGATGIVLVFAMFFGVRAVMEPAYSTLYRDMDPAEAGRIVGALEQAGYRVRVDSGGAAISVPQEDLARARMEMAGQGLVSDGAAGWELFDEGSGLGMNAFMQRINRLRALEGELARSVQTLDGVEAARVHLVLPEREAFSRERPQPSASVIVRGRPGHQVTTRQAQSIRALVSSAVPEMAPGRVTVLTSNGATVLAEDGEGAAEVTQQAVRTSVEDRIAANVTDILTARVGAGNARVKVSVDLTTERQVIRNQSFDPDQRVVRSTEIREENREDLDRGQGEVGVIDDIPASLTDTGNAEGSSNTMTRTDEVVNYEIGTTESETVREPGEIERISVAVLVNGIYNVQDNGDVVYEERSAEELQRLNQLVQAAIGFDQQRGDTISVDSLRFMDYSMDVGEPISDGIMDVLKQNMMSILRGVFALAVVAAVLRFGVMPVVARALPERIEVDKKADPALTEGEEGETQLVEGPNGPQPQMIGNQQQARVQHIHSNQPQAQTIHHHHNAMSGQVLGPDGYDDGNMVNLASVKGGVQRGWIETVSELIEKQPDDSLKVVKTWLAEGP